MAVRRDSVWKYCWGVLMVLCRTAISKSIVLEPIYWNSSNSKFLPGQGLVLYPQIGDKLDIICPKVDSKTVGQYEYYKVYMVDKDQADRCTIKKENTPLLNCAKPDQDIKFTIKFQEFSPNLWGLEFQKNKDYYIISVIFVIRYSSESCQILCVWDIGGYSTTTTLPPSKRNRSTS
ncbi:ephrin-B2 isoform X3 [Nomascus leucogenys]|uniref:ephrin-B2 isoform X3 n=1 Tax=Nomascus leucogenys TaxID=61853 RepID=UPI00122D6862|nr:ephrin-B2 isoform X3 [Nomascus leucogenys]